MSDNPLLKFCQLNVKQTEEIVPKESFNDKLSKIKLLSDKISIVREMIKTCNELPNEWTVIQICKRFNNKRPYQLKEEDITEFVPLNITLFCYARSALLDNEPFTIELRNIKGK